MYGKKSKTLKISDDQRCHLKYQEEEAGFQVEVRTVDTREEGKKVLLSMFKF